MPTDKKSAEKAVREAAYFMWEREGRPHGRDQDHWLKAAGGEPGPREQDESNVEDEEKVLDGLPDANIPAMLTKDVPGG